MKIENDVKHSAKVHACCWECGLRGIIYRVITFDNREKYNYPNNFRLRLCENCFEKLRVKINDN